MIDERVLDRICRVVLRVEQERGRRAAGDPNLGGQIRALPAGRLIPDLPSLAKGFHRFLHRQEDRRLERTARTARTDRQRDRGHGYVVGSLPEVVAVVRTEGVPEPVELATDRLDVGLGSLSPILRLADEPRPGLRRVAELR